MGQAPFCTSCDRHGGKVGNAVVKDQQEGHILRLSALEPGLFDSASILEEANEALLETVTLLRSGKLADAVEKLRFAEGMLREAPDTAPAEQLRRACCTDPELQMVRQRSLMQMHRGISSDSLPVEKTPKPKRKKGRKSSDPKVGEVDAGSILAGLEADIAGVRALCRCCHIFEAQAAWGTLVEKTKAGFRECRKLEDARLAITELSKLLTADPQFVKLRAIHARLNRAVVMLRSSDTKGSLPVVLKDPMLGDAFKMEVVVRACEGQELEKGGAATQLYVIIRIYNWPVSLVKLASVDVEADLFKKEWCQDCKRRDVYLGGEISLNSSFSVMHINLKPTPFAIEDINIREFALFSKAPTPDSRPGVLVLESGAPIEEGKFENWSIPPPPKARGHYRLGAGMKVHYKMRSQDSDDCTDIISISKVDLPIPAWLLPISTFKNLVSKKAVESCRLMKEGMLDKWPEHEFDARIAQNPDLYNAVKVVQDLAAALPRGT